MNHQSHKFNNISVPLKTRMIRYDVSFN